MGRAGTGPAFGSADLGGNAGGDFNGAPVGAALCSETLAALGIDEPEGNLDVGGNNTGVFPTADADSAAAGRLQCAKAASTSCWTSSLAVGCPVAGVACFGATISAVPADSAVGIATPGAEPETGG